MDINKTFKDCEIFNVYEKIMPNIKNLNSYLVEIIINDTNEHFDIKIDKPNLYEELLELIDNKRKRICATYGMTDIDIYKGENKYCISWSPSVACYYYFYFDEDEFVKNFVNALMPYENKMAY